MQGPTHAAVIVIGVAATLLLGARGSILAENKHAGVHRWDWDVNGAADPGVSAFPNVSSASPGTVVGFTIVSDAPSLFVDIYRLGWYGGDGARLVGSAEVIVDLPTRQPLVESEPCTKCHAVARWSVPEDARSGVYVARISRGDDLSGNEHVDVPNVPYPDAIDRHVRDAKARAKRLAHFGNKNATHALFVVRPASAPRSENTVVVRVADLAWGTRRLPNASARGVSRYTFSAPQDPRADAETSFFANDYPAIRFLERTGYDVVYLSSVDFDRAHSAPWLLGSARTLIVLGTDASWSEATRIVLRDAEANGVSRLFLGAGDAPHDLRWLDDAYRTFESVPRDPEMEEGDVTGVSQQHVTWSAKAIAVEHPAAAYRPWARSRFETARKGKTFRMALGRILGALSHRQDPYGYLRLSNTSVAWTYRRTGEELHHCSDGVQHAMFLRRSANTAALTFVAASSGFAAALDGLEEVRAPSVHTPFGATPPRVHLEPHGVGADAALQQLLVNLLALAGHYPPADAPTIQPGVVGDQDAPHCEIVDATWSPNAVTVSVEATDSAGAVAEVWVGMQGHEAKHQLTRVEGHPNDRHAQFIGTLRREDGVALSHAHQRPALYCFAVDDAGNAQHAPGVERVDHPPVPAGASGDL